ncbi:MAG: ASKHA domain-containing protein [Eubacteriales bacterium]|jgi:uncharacterized 2Fe-2S/4Fe-4S cluster protein (DUF4445 family)
MKLTLIDGNRRIEIGYTTPTLLSSLFAEKGVEFALPCGGKGRCLKCRVHVEGEADPPDARERALLGESDLAAGVRYACMTTVTGDVTVTLPVRSGLQTGNGGMRIQSEGVIREIPKDPWAEGCGAAVDIGTTTVAGYLYDFTSGTLLASRSLPNPQGIYGADVVTRIEKSLAGERAGLAASVRGCINTLLGEMCADAGITPGEIGGVVVTGNTAMCYLLTARDPYKLSRSPFIADFLFGEWFEPDALGLCTLRARVYVMRGASAFVGGDITAGMLATGLCEQNEKALLADIGTNGEMALWTGTELLCCATAAGPAFEGVGISCGMTAREGAISRVTLRGHTVYAETIGGGHAEGICGSGLIDAVAAYVKLGVIDETGYLDEDADEEGYLTDAGELRVGQTDVVLTQKDIRAVQLAKSAICAGMETLLDEAGLTIEEIGVVYLAGGFGTVLNAESAEAIGLLPVGFAQKTVAVGNAAGMGAGEVLRSGEMLRRSEELAGRARTVALAESPVFMERFVENMQFSR